MEGEILKCIKCRRELKEGDEFIFLDEVYKVVKHKTEHQDGRIVVNEYGDYTEIELCSKCLEGVGCKIGGNR